MLSVTDVPPNDSGLQPAGACCAGALDAALLLAPASQLPAAASDALMAAAWWLRTAMSVVACSLLPAFPAEACCLALLLPGLLGSAAMLSRLGPCCRLSICADQCGGCAAICADAGLYSGRNAGGGAESGARALAMMFTATGAGPRVLLLPPTRGSPGWSARRCRSPDCSKGLHLDQMLYCRVGSGWQTCCTSRDDPSSRLQWYSAPKLFVAGPSHPGLPFLDKGLDTASSSLAAGCPDPWAPGSMKVADPSPMPASLTSKSNL